MLIAGTHARATLYTYTRTHHTLHKHTLHTYAHTVICFDAVDEEAHGVMEGDANQINMETGDQVDGMSSVIMHTISSVSTNIIWLLHCCCHSSTYICIICWN